MEATFIDHLIQGGAMGMFAAFLVWQHIQNTKRNDSLTERFQQQLETISKDYDSRIDTMRDRYDVVIADIKKEHKEAERDWSGTRSRIQETVVTAITENGSRLDALTDAVSRVEAKLG